MYESDQSGFDAGAPEESNNRTFLIAAAILAGSALIGDWLLRSGMDAVMTIISSLSVMVG